MLGLQVARRMKRSFLPWLITLILVAAAWFKLFTLSSILNKMAYQVRASRQAQGRQYRPATCLTAWTRQSALVTLDSISSPHAGMLYAMVPSACSLALILQR